MRNVSSRHPEEEVVRFFAKMTLEEEKPFSKIQPELQKCTEVALTCIDKIGETLNPNLIDGAVQRLQSRKVGWLSIVLGFVSIIFAWWAWNKYEENKQIDEESKKLQQLAVRISASSAVATLSKIQSISERVYRLLNQNRSKWDIANLRQIENCFAQLQASREEACRKIEEFEKRFKEFPIQGLHIPQDKLSALEVAKLVEQAAQKKIQEIAAILPQLPKGSSDSYKSTHSEAAITGLQASQPAVLSTAPQLPMNHVRDINPMCGGKPVHLCGIQNPGNACYAIAALQAIRFNSNLRQLVERELPRKEFYSGKIFDIPEGEYRNRQKMQSELRDILRILDRGQTVPAGVMGKFIGFCHRTLGIAAPLGIQDDSRLFLSSLLDKLLMSTATVCVEGKPDEYVDSGLGMILENRYIIRPESANLLEGHRLEQPLKVASNTAGESIISLEMRSAKVASFYGTENLLALSDFSNPYSILLEQASGNLPMKEGFRIFQENNEREATFLREHVCGEVVNPDTASSNSVLVQKDGRYYNAGTGYAQTLLCNTPPLITLHLKRLITDELGHQQIRINGPVNIPDQIDIKPLLAENMPIIGSNLYQLSSVVVHAGSASGGHYYMYQRTDDGKWICCDDSTLTLVDHFDPSSCEGSYVLMYKQLTT